jgi:hypothetical protein
MYTMKHRLFLYRYLILPTKRKVITRIYMIRNIEYHDVCKVVSGNRLTKGEFLALQKYQQVTSISNKILPN